MQSALQGQSQVIAENARRQASVLSYYNNSYSQPSGGGLGGVLGAAVGSFTNPFFGTIGAAGGNVISRGFGNVLGGK